MRSGSIFAAEIRKHRESFQGLVSSTFSVFRDFSQNSQFSQLHAILGMQLVTCFQKSMPKKKKTEFLRLFDVHLFLQFIIVFFSFLFFVYKFANSTMKNNSTSVIICLHIFANLISSHVRVRHQNNYSQMCAALAAFVLTKNVLKKIISLPFSPVPPFLFIIFSFVFCLFKVY